jgi:hypothetical protein
LAFAGDSTIKSFDMSSSITVKKIFVQFYIKIPTILSLGF